MAKRSFDLVFALAGLVLLAPFFAAIALWIKLDSQGAIFFRQKRVGKHGMVFRIHKFRTMVVVAEKLGGQLTIGEDSRITRSGSFLRKYKLDELPQLIDVVLGDMSLVGPRPEVPKYIAYYPESVRAEVLSVRPGITDWASIQFKDENDILGCAPDPERAYIEEVLPVKQRYYLEYVRTRSFIGDMQIIFATLFAVFGR